MKKLSWVEFLGIVRIYSEKAATYLKTAVDGGETVKAFYKSQGVETQLDGLLLYRNHPILSAQEWRDLTNKVNEHIANMEPKS